MRKSPGAAACAARPLFQFHSRRGRMRSRPALLLQLLLGVLLPPGPALGNEGGAAGSCNCERHRQAPILVTRFPEKLLFWEICKDLVRFTFKQRKVCGLVGAEWVINFQNSQAAKRRGGSLKPTPTCRVSPSSPTSVGPVTAGDAPDKISGTQLTLDVHTDSAQAPGMVWSSIPPPSSGAAGAGPSHFPQQALPAQDYKAAVISLLVVALTAVAVAVAVAVACRTRHKSSGRPSVEPGTEQLFVHLAET